MQPVTETMLTRKEMKKRGKRSLKQHYLIFVAACLIAAFLGAEFRDSLDFSTAQTYEIEGEDSTGSTEFSVSSPGWAVSWDDVLMQIADKDTAAGRELSDQLREDAIEKAEQGNPMFGRTRGVLSDIVNRITSGSIIVTGAAAIGSITGSDSAGLVILILCGVIVYFLFWFLLQNVFSVVVRRIFLEGLTYSQVTPQRFIFLLRIKKWLKASWTMLVTYVFYTLWSLTIIGAVIKRYSYYMVPFIVAENPDIRACDAITLSRRMMKGHKWECFIFELSFLGWSILGSLTLGIVDILFANPYKIAAFTQYYAQLRALAREKHIPGSEMLYDWYLYEKPDPALLREKYADVYAVTQQPPDPDGDLTGWRGFLARNLGLLLFSRQEEKEYERRQAEHVRIHALIDDMQGLAYPVRFYPIPEENKRKLVQSLNYMRHYTIWSLIVIFLGLAFFGWVWEVSLHLITDGEFVNRAVWPMAPDLRYRLYPDPDTADQVKEEPCTGIHSDNRGVRLPRVYDFRIHGIYFRRTEMVGLQRIFSEPERTDLCGRTACIRNRRDRGGICDRPHYRQRADGSEREEAPGGMYRTDGGISRGLCLFSGSSECGGRDHGL